MADTTAPAAEVEKTLIEVYKPLHAMLKVICADRGITIAEALQRFAGPGVLREYRKVIRDLNAELGGEG
jgi:hypothetical protein